MLSRTDRNIVEGIRKASTIKVVINENHDDELIIEARHRVKSITRLAHEVAIAWQNFFVEDDK